MSATKFLYVKLSAIKL